MWAILFQFYSKKWDLYKNITMEIFNNEIKDFINNLIEEKLPILKENTDFKEKYLRLSDAMDELDKTLSKNQKELFDEIVDLFYATEKYYFTLSYSLGLKYGEDLKKI